MEVCQVGTLPLLLLLLLLLLSLLPPLLPLLPLPPLPPLLPQPLPLPLPLGQRADLRPAACASLAVCGHLPCTHPATLARQLRLPCSCCPNPRN